MAMAVSKVGHVVRLTRNGLEMEYRVDAVDARGSILRASVKHTDPELIQAVGVWDDVRNLSRLAEIDLEIGRLSNSGVV